MRSLRRPHRRPGGPLRAGRLAGLALAQNNTRHGAIGSPASCDLPERGRQVGLSSAELLHCPNISLGPVRACTLLTRNYDPWQHRSPLHELRFVLGALLGTNWRRELLGRVLLAWLLLASHGEGELAPAVRGTRHPHPGASSPHTHDVGQQADAEARAPRRVRDRRCYAERDGGQCVRPGCPFLHARDRMDGLTAMRSRNAARSTLAPEVGTG